MSIQTIYANKTIGITDLKRGDTKFLDNFAEPIAVLNRDSIKAYLIPEQMMKHFIEMQDDIKLKQLVNKRIQDLEQGKTKTIKVNIDEL
jgi:PHD/YefM family antitoxin component YafN of YafNO toxin-antitoxin module